MAFQPLYEKLKGIVGDIFQFSMDGPVLKGIDATHIGARNAADDAFINMQGADPVVDDDLVTLRYFNATPATGSVQVIRFVIDETTPQNSVTEIPDNAYCVLCQLEITTAYDSGTTITIGDETTPAKFQVTTDNRATKLGTYQVEQDTLCADGPSTVEVTIAGAPVAGAGIVTVWYVVPDA